MDKNFLLSFSSSNYGFPVEKLDKDCLKYKDFLFNNNSQKFNKINSSELSNSFLLASKTGNSNQVRSKNQWRQVGQNENSDRPPAGEKYNSVNETVDFLRGDKLNTSEVANFVKGSKVNNNNNLEKEEKISKNKFENIEDTMQQIPKQETNNGNLSERNDVNDTMNKNNTNILANLTDVNEETFNEFYKNPSNDSAQSNYARNVQMAFIPQAMPSFMMPHPQMFSPNVTMKFESVNIENIFLFNNKLNFPNDQPLWYVCSPWNGTIGPLSSKQLLDMYQRKQLDGNFDFRPLDIFNFHNIHVTKNEFAKLKIINSEDWFENIKDSPLLQFTELYLTSKKLLEPSEKAVKKETQQIVREIEKNNYKTAPVENESLQFTQNIFPRDSDEIENFMTDTVIQPGKNDFTTIIDLGKQIESESTNWEKVDKKKKKLKEIDNSFYMVGNKPKKEEPKKENKFTYKVDIVAPEELAKQLASKNQREENKPKFEAFVVESNTDQQSAKNKKKAKGKPQDLNIKLGFKY